jgi:hypothetical protein
MKTFSDAEREKFLRANPGLLKAIFETVPTAIRFAFAGATALLWLYRSTQPSAPLVDSVVFYLVGIQIATLVIPDRWLRKHPILLITAVSTALYILARLSKLDSF